MRCTIVAVIFLIFFTVCHICTASVNCTANGEGRFPDPNDSINCKKYTFCVYHYSTNTFIDYNYICPTTSLFNPEISKCTTNYVCNFNSSSNNTEFSSICTTEGRFADPDSGNCSSYIQCYGVNGTFKGEQLFCQNSSYFNPDTQECEPNYNCTTELSDNTTEFNIQAEFTCASTGRYEDTTHPTCKAYFMCVLERNGSLTKYKYTCPNNSFFNPMIKQCTTLYTCPR